MNPYYRFYLLLFLSVLLVPVVVTGQEEPGGLYLTGKVTTEQGRVDGALVRMTLNGKQLNDYNVLPDGKFNLRFEFNNDYTLVFTRPGNFPQKVVISTKVPTEVLHRDRKFPPFPLDINLFTEVKGIDRTFSENAILKIFYSPSVDNFIPEVYYNDAQIKKLIDQAIWQSQHVTKESDLLKKISAAELAEMKKEYNGYLKNAGAEFDKQEYINALGDYKSALRIFPDEQFPKDRIAEINDLIAVLGLQAELDRQLAEKYARYIQTADQQFNSKNYIESKENYSQALFIKPGDPYATGRLAEIEKIVAAQETDKKYSDFISLADKAFNEKLWDQSKSRYNEALRLKPGETYPLAQISKIDGELLRLEQQADKKENFETAVLNGDAAYNKQFYSKAIAFYETALTYNPDNQSVALKIEKCRKEQKSIADKLFYDETIANADKAFNKKEYEKARELYSSALNTLPGQSYPQKQMDAIDRIFDKNREYTRHLTEGDALFLKQDYPGAKEEFSKALALKPGEGYPAGKIREIDGILATQEKAEQEYRQMIAAADKLFSDNKLAQARTEFQKAATRRPADPYPPRMLSRISEAEAQALKSAAEKESAEKARLLAEQELINQKYKSLIDEADLFAGQEKLIEAVGKFRAALEVKPHETYPLKRIEEIRGIIARQAEMKKAYDAAILTADKAFKLQQYPAARTAYQQAQQAISDETYPGEMIAKIDAIEAGQARLAAEKKVQEEAAQRTALEEKEKQYNLAITGADASFGQKQYAQAIAGYNNALKIKPGESYPKEKIAESEKILGELAAAKKAYDAAILTADKAFRQQQYPAARTAYQQAQQAISDETYPGEMIAKIDAIEAGQARLAAEKKAQEEAARLTALEEKEKQYNLAITGADAFFGQKQYPQAIAGYNNALKIKPGESYPKEKIAESERIMAGLAAAKKAYDAAILTADKAFRQQQYPAARTAYQQAQQAISDETYPGEMIAKIDAIEAEQARLAAEKKAQEEAARLTALEEKEKQYNLAITGADASFGQNQYAQAIAGYNNALKIKPGENYPKERIAESERIMAGLAAAKKAYDAAILTADKAFKLQQYPAARTAYQQAQQAKSDESYPGEMIAKIDAIEAGQARLAAEKKAQEEAAQRTALEEKEKQYNLAITGADAFFGQKQYPQAIAGYQNALRIKPGESYPTEKIAESERIMGEIAAAKKAYDAAILTADKAFRQQQYPAARTAYQQAQQAKPDETYPGEMIAKIDTIEAEQVRLAAEKKAQEEAAQRTALEEKERQYTQAITGADASFGQKQYPQAIAGYQNALRIKPGESYPTEKIAESERIMAGLAAAKKAYDAAILTADKAFKLQQYPAARTAYQQAQQAKPDETYPGEMIAKIDAIEAGQARLAAEKKAQEEAARLAIRQKYDQVILEADKALAGNLWDEAEKSYSEARNILPGESYPTAQIAKIAEFRTTRLKEQILALVEKGDNALAKEAYDEAEKNYGDALHLAPADKDIAAKLAEAGQLKKQKMEALQEAENKNREYIRLITLADRAFQTSAFQDASSGYRSAAEIKPDEIYPGAQLAKIDSILKVREVDAQYRSVLVAADAAFRSSNLDIARENYTKASVLRPSEAYPQKQIALIDEMIRQRVLRSQSASEKNENTQKTVVLPVAEKSTEKMIREETDALYASMIASADQGFIAKEYNVSRAWYYKALEIKPGEPYPAARISEINSLLANMQFSQLEREFQQYIDKADESFRSDQLAVARSWYNRALGIKENDKYARSQLMEIQIKINERLQGDTNKTYDTFMDQGNKALAQKEFSVARVWFQRALQIKHGDEAALIKLDAVRKAMAGEE